MMKEKEGDNECLFYSKTKMSLEKRRQVMLDEIWKEEDKGIVCGVVIHRNPNVIRSPYFIMMVEGVAD